jgi:hypothetical protein
MTTARTSERFQEQTTTWQKVSTRAEALDPRVVSHRYRQLMNPEPIVRPRRKWAAVPARLRGDVFQTRDPVFHQ